MALFRIRMLLVTSAALAVVVDPRMPGELVRAAEALLAARVGATKRLLACVCTDVSGLAFGMVEEREVDEL